ncbi:hypothetical protein MPTK2_1g19270 [Marchantia polymorpha subsp. ruderalis]
MRRRVANRTVFVDEFGHCAPYGLETIKRPYRTFHSLRSQTKLWSSPRHRLTVGPGPSVDDLLVVRDRNQMFCFSGFRFFFSFFRVEILFLSILCTHCSSVQLMMPCRWEMARN